MAFLSKRFRLVLIVSVCVILIGVVLGWLIIIPGIIESRVSDALVQAGEKTGRTIAVSGIRLSGLKSVRIGRTTISDVGQPEKTGVSLDDVDIALSGLPVGDFTIASVDVEDIHVHVRTDGGKSNFDDVIEALRPREKVGGGKPKAPPKWKKYLTPLPEIRVGSVAVTMPQIRISDDLEVGAVSGSGIVFRSVPESDLPYDLAGELEVLLIEHGRPTTYGSRLTGRIRDGKHGTVTLTQPLSKDRQIPAILKPGGSQIDFESVTFGLPATFTLQGLAVTEGNRALIKAESVRAQLMALPPKKVSGVYLKEVELIKPEIHDVIRPEGSTLVNWAQSAARVFAKSFGRDPGPEAQNTAGDIAGQAAAAAIGAGLKAAAENSDHPEAEIAKAVVNEVVPKPVKNPKDYFFSQRMFITDGTVIIDDQRKNTAQAAVDKINLEVGYRGIRKVVDYQLGFHVYEPFLGDVSLSGRYDMPGERLGGTLTVTPMRAAGEFRNFQANLQDGTKQGENAGILAKFLPKMDLSKTVFDASLAFDADFRKKNVDLTSRFSVKDLVWHLEALSKEPTDFSGSVAVTLGADWDRMALNLKAVELESSGSKLGLSAKFAKEPRKFKPKKGAEQTADAWHFDIAADLPDQRMNDLFESIPHALRNEIDGLSFRGSLGIKFEASGFFDALSETQHKLSLVTSNDFAVLEWPVDRNINALNNGFKHTVQDPNALKEHVIAIPPSIYPVYQGDYPLYNPRMSANEVRANYPDWVLFDDLNPWLVQLITTTEDGSFFSHSGFSPLQIKAALEKNVNKQSFSRGASTISMQLVKNIFFDRSKTISRKFQEFIYTWLMESVVRIPKKRIMELYFNIIEFGPEIYGIEEAAKYYFGKRSRALSLKECAFLMAIIPNPRNGANYRSKTILDKWLQKTMTFYMSEMYRRKCDPAVLARMKERSRKEGKDPTFVPCCPPRDSLQLMMNSETLDFYMPDPLDPLQYGYRLDQYTPDGTPLTPLRPTNCGMIDDAGEIQAEQEAESIFGTFVPDMNEN